METSDRPASPAPATPELDQLRRQALSDDPTVRTQVADRLRTMMEQDFEAVFDATQEWALDPDDRLREVACRSLRHRVEVTDEVQARRLISRAELLLGDRNPRLARLATTDILPYLLGLHPAVAPGWVRTWTVVPEENVRADVAATLAAITERFPTEAVEGLAELAVDPRPRVHSAVARALEDLTRRLPKMRPYLEARVPDFFGEA